MTKKEKKTLFEEDIESADIEILPAEDPDSINELEDPPISKKRKAEKKSLVRYDPLQAYLSELKQYTSLSKEEERDLAIRFQEHGDRDAAYQLIVNNLNLVVIIARKYQRAARHLLDLIQEGNIGLMDAVKNFDPYKNVRFPSYATWWIKAYIIRYIMANWRLVKIGTTQAQRKLFFNLEKEKNKLTSQGFVPTTKLLASNLNVKEREVIEMQQRLRSSDLSVDAPIGEESSSNLHGILADNAPSTEELLAKQEISQKISTAINSFKDTLNERERFILDSRLLAEEKLTLNEIAEQFKLSKERIRQIESRIKDKLKTFVLEELGESFLDIEMDLI